jgi:hypothetical protein
MVRIRVVQCVYSVCGFGIVGYVCVVLCYVYVVLCMCCVVLCMCRVMYVLCCVQEFVILLKDLSDVYKLCQKCSMLVCNTIVCVGFVSICVCLIY